MYKTFYTVADKFLCKKIYIYGVNRDSISVFTDLAFRDSDIAGFCDNRFVGQTFMNRQIVSEEQLCTAGDSILVLSKEIEKNSITDRVDESKLFYPDELFEINQCLRDEKVYIYGIGKQGEKVYQMLVENGIKFENGCVTQKDNSFFWHDKPVLSIDEIEQDTKCAIIVATVTESYKREMLKKLEQCAANNIYIDCLMPFYIITQGNFFQVIHKAVSEKKNLFLYGKRDTDATQFVERTLERFQVKIKGYVYERELKEQGVCDVYDLAYEDIENTTVVIAEQNMWTVEHISDVLDSLGFALEKWNYTSIELNTKRVRNRLHTKTDYLLGWSNQNEKYPGYVVYGEDNDTDIKIMVLGGSTSTDGMFRTVSWVRIFYSILVEKGYQVTVYNGATHSHGIVEEFLRLCRDGAYLKPDYVISFSGVNNTARKKVDNQFCERWLIDTFGLECISGIKSDESLYDFWYRLTKLMGLVSEAYGAKFYSFLQPIYAPDKRQKLWEVSIYEMEDRADNILLFRKRSKEEKNALYMNLIDLFDEKDDAFIDAAHYSTGAAKIIGKAVYEIMSSEEGKMEKKQTT